jgi:hypothetical protein
VRGKPARWQLKPPPPPPKWRGPHVGTHQNGPPGHAKWTRQDRPRSAKTCQTRHLSRDRGREKKGATRHFSNCSLIKDYFKILISHNSRANLAPSLLQCQSSPISFLRAVRRENVSYIVTRAYKRPAKTTHLSQSATLHSTGNISAEVRENKNKAGHSSTRGTVSSLLFFPLKVLLHTVYIFNIFTWTEVIDSRRLLQKKPYR